MEQCQKLPSTPLTKNVLKTTCWISRRSYENLCVGPMQCCIQRCRSSKISLYIRKINVTGGGTHYFNVINGQVFDLTRDQFDLYNLPVDYSSSINVPIKYCGKNANTRDRYDILEKILIKLLSVQALNMFPWTTNVETLALITKS